MAGSVAPGSVASAASPRLTAGLLACIVSAALAGLLFGFDTAVISGTTAGLRAEYGLDDVWLGVTVSAALWGTLAGALLAGAPGDRFGSRDTLRVLALFYVAGGLGCGLAWSWESLVFFRVVAGLAVGGSSVLAPIYIAEVAPPARRGGLVGTFQLMVIAGILAAYVSNAIIASLELGADDWRWKFGVSAAPALLFLLLLFRIPNSPRWLVARGRDDEARAALARVGMTPADAGAEVVAVRATLAAAPGTARLSWRRHRKPILLAFAIAAFNQLSGINAMLYYLNDIFAVAHGGLSADVQAVIIGVVNGVFTLVGMALIDRVGRRTLLLAGSAGMVASLVVAGLALSGAIAGWWVLPALIAFIAFFAPGSGAVIWVYISEIFPTDVRGRGSAVGASTHWGFDAVIAAVFPSIAAVSVGLPFFVFAAMMAAQFVLVLLFFPETRGVPLEEMERRLGVDGT